MRLSTSLNRNRPHLAPLAFLAMLVGLAAPALRADDQPAAPTQTPLQFIDQVSHQVIGILVNKNLTTSQKQRQIDAIAFNNLDFPVISRLTLGRFWNTLSDAQRADFMRQYRAHLSNTYRGMIDNYHDEKVVMAGQRAEGRGDYTALTKVIDPNNPDQSFKVDYRVRAEQGQWRIIDITVEGVSLVSNFREQFQEIIDNDGFEKLMSMLRKKNAEAAQKGGESGK